MKGAIVAALLLAAAPARAEDAEEPPVKLGARISAGLTADRGEQRGEFSLGLGIEHPVFRHVRVMAEYEWMWMLGGPDPTMHPEHATDGQRVLVGLRQEFAHSHTKLLRWFADVELGGGVALLNDSETGLRVEPTGFAGLRGGYSIAAKHEPSPSAHFEADLTLRLVATPDGGGTLFGVGMHWD